MHRYKQPEKTSNYFLHSRKVWELFRMTGGYVESGILKFFLFTSSVHHTYVPQLISRSLYMYLFRQKHFSSPSHISIIIIIDHHHHHRPKKSLSLSSTHRRCVDFYSADSFVGGNSWLLAAAVAAVAAASPSSPCVFDPSDFGRRRRLPVVCCCPVSFGFVRYNPSG